MTTPDSGTTLETWRLLIIRRDGDEMLVITAGEKCALPQVDIPTQQRIAANINRAVERELGLRVISLYEVVPCDAALNATVPYHAVAAVPPAQAPPAGMHWACMQIVDGSLLLARWEFAAIDAFREVRDRKNRRRRATLSETQLVYGGQELGRALATSLFIASVRRIPAV